MNGGLFSIRISYYVRERAIFFSFSSFLFFLFFLLFLLSPFFFSDIVEVDGPFLSLSVKLSSFSRLKRVKTEEVGVSRSRRRAARVLVISYL